MNEQHIKDLAKRLYLLDRGYVEVDTHYSDLEETKYLVKAAGLLLSPEMRSLVEEMMIEAINESMRKTAQSLRDVVPKVPENVSGRDVLIQTAAALEAGAEISELDRKFNA